jgi:MFS family permease
MWWSIYFAYYYMQLYVEFHGWSQTLAFYTLAMINGASFFGRLFLPKLADNIGGFNVMIPCAVVTCITAFTINHISSVAGVILFCIVYGFFSGGYISLGASTVRSFCKDETDYGVRLGISLFTMSFFILTGTPLDGALLHPLTAMWKPVTFGGCTMLAGCICLIIARQMLAKRKGTQWI